MKKYEDLSAALEYSDEMLKSTIKKLENEVAKRAELNRNWILVWLLTNVIWMVIK